MWISLFLGDTILQLFGISIDSFRIAGGILVVTIAMSMISGKLGEDKQNKQEKSETAVRESIGVVHIGVAVDGGARGDQFYHRLGYAGITALAICLVSFVAVALFALCCWGLFHGTVAGTGFTPDRHRVITRIMGLLLMALGIEFIVTGIKGIFPACLINSFQMKRNCHAPFTSSLFLLCSRAVIKSKRNR